MLRGCAITHAARPLQPRGHNHAARPHQPRSNRGCWMPGGVQLSGAQAVRAPANARHARSALSRSLRAWPLAGCPLGRARPGTMGWVLFPTSWESVGAHHRLARSTCAAAACCVHRCHAGGQSAERQRGHPAQRGRRWPTGRCCCAYRPLRPPFSAFCLCFSAFQRAGRTGLRSILELFPYANAHQGQRRLVVPFRLCAHGTHGQSRSTGPHRYVYAPPPGPHPS